jgi:hypothetical protein
MLMSPTIPRIDGLEMSSASNSERRPDNTIVTETTIQSPDNDNSTLADHLRPVERVSFVSTGFDPGSAVGGVSHPP